MKTRLLAAVAALLIYTSPVLAGSYELECGAPTTLVGEDASDPNPVVRVSVRYSYDNRSWQVFHILRNGAVVSRSGQYAITDMSGANKTQWQGKLLRQPWLTMIGELKKNTTSEYDYGYHEWMYDGKRGNALVMQAWAPCKSAQPLPKPTVQAPTQPYVQAPSQPYAQAPTNPVQPVTAPYSYAESKQPQQPPPQQAALPGKDSVPIIVSADGKMVHVDMIVGGQPVRMHLDTGATQMTITDAIATKIVRDRQGSYGPKSRGMLANGTVHETYTVLINEVRIGTHTIRNVTAAVMDSLLLPFPLVNSIAPFTIDTRAGELVFHTAKS